MISGKKESSKPADILGLSISSGGNCKWKYPKRIMFDFWKEKQGYLCSWESDPEEEWKGIK